MPCDLAGTPRPDAPRSSTCRACPATRSALADLVEPALRALPHLERRPRRQRRRRPHRARPRAAGAARRPPRHRADRRQRAVAASTGGRLSGCGTSDMKSGDAVLLHLAATLPRPGVRPDLRALRQRGGRGRRERPQPARRDPPRLARRRPRRPHGADGRRRSRPAARARCASRSRSPGARAHSARGWLGENADPRRRAAAGRAGRATSAREVDIDGCTYREGLNAVRDRGRGGRQRHPGRLHASRSTSASPRTAPRSRRCDARARGARAVRRACSPTPRPAPCPA